MFQAFQAGIRDETYLQLRQILERQNGHSYTLEETKEIDNESIDFYTLLAKLAEESDGA